VYILITSSCCNYFFLDKVFFVLFWIFLVFHPSAELLFCLRFQVKFLSACEEVGEKIWLLDAVGSLQG